MQALEAACAAIVVLYLAVRLRTARDRPAAIVRLACLALGAWAGEDSVIRAYGFYAYSPAWSLFVDRVPLVIIAIWPVVIDSAHVIAKSVGGSRVKTALLGGAIVLGDASLIEPIAVHARLWTWSAANARSVFDVPAIGIVGWALFAWAAIATFEALDGRNGMRAARGADLAVVVTAPLATHGLLALAWWSLFKWVAPGALPPLVPALAAWTLTAPVAALAWRAGDRVPLAAVLSRAPGAAFFFALLGVTDAPPELTIYALAFAPPYLTCIARRALTLRGARSSGGEAAPS